MDFKGIELTTEINNYLIGQNFDTDFQFDFSKQSQIIEKVDLLKSLFNNKSVLHIGFADHQPIIDEKIKNKTWVHDIINDVSSELYGIDINEEAIIHLKKNYKTQNIFHLDILQDDLPPELIDEHFDYIFLGETLEHLNNPVAFLKEIVFKTTQVCKNIVVTVPNVFADIITTSAKEGKERINTDHRYWFTPYTACKVLTESGILPKQIFLCNSYFPLDRKSAKKAIKNPLLNHTIVVIGSW